MKPADISVAISLYNKQHAITRAVESVLNQTLKPRNIIIVDDGSTDNSSDIAKELSLRYPSVTYIHQHNQGASAARNKGVEAASTEFVCLLDADDVWEPFYVHNLIELAEEVADADLYCLAYQMQDEKGLLKPKVALPHQYKGLVADSIKTYSRGYGLIHTSAVCIRKKLFYQIGGFPVGENFGEDLYFWLKAGLTGKIAFIDKISVTLHKEPVNSLKRREHHPYHVSYFVNNLHYYTKKEQTDLKEFLIKNIYLQWAAAKLEKNTVQQNILLNYCYKLSVIRGMFLSISDFLSPKIFEFIKHWRNKRRIIH